MYIYSVTIGHTSGREEQVIVTASTPEAAEDAVKYVHTTYAYAYATDIGKA